MPIFDLHADSLVKAFENGYSLKDSPRLQVNLEKIISQKYFCQCLAIFVNDDIQNAYNYYKNVVNFYNQQLKGVKVNKVGVNKFKKRKTNVILSVENAVILGDDLSKIDEIYNDGVKMVTLVWNNENLLAFSHKDEDKGLKPFGYKCIEKFNQKGIIVDLSHISKKGFNDACLFSKKPVVASHSNSKSICNHSRNLSDENLKYLAKNGGVVGINFYPPFLSLSKNVDYTQIIIKHVKQIVKVAGIDSVAIGSDFDGIEQTCCINEPKKVQNLIDRLSRSGFTSRDIDKISYKNALRVFNENGIF